MPSHYELEIIRVIAGLFGAYFLFNEVRLAHKVESLKQRKEKAVHFLNSPDAKRLRELSLLLSKTNDQDVKAMRELLIQYQAFGLGDYEVAKTLYASIPDEKIKELYKENYSGIKFVFDENEKMEEWIKSMFPIVDKLTSEGKLKSRKRNLYIGFVLVVVSFGIDLYLRLI